MADREPPTGPGSEDPGASNPSDPKEIKPDPFFENMGLDPNQPLTGIVCYMGILARSPKEGFWMLYLGLDMSEHLEIRAEDIVSSQPLPPEQSPFGSLGGTLVCVRQGAQIQHVQTSSSQLQAGSEFDLNVQIGPRAMGQLAAPVTQAATCGDTCQGDTCDTCVTCLTCPTGCATCFTCQTCLTQCQGTCQTCFTCHTCQTCVTCGTCQTRCGQTCFTCAATCALTCHTCVTCQTCQVRCYLTPGCHLQTFGCAV